MPSPIVHIGFHKTATSWFQAAVFPQLRSHRYIDREFARRVFISGDAFDFDPAAARLALGLDRDGPPPLISEEDFSGILHIGLASSYIAKEIAARVHATMPEANIVIFVRSQFTATSSWYNQYLREGGTASLKRYIFPDEYLYTGKSVSFKIARFDFAQLDYKGLIEEYDRLFGREKVHILTYEDFAHDRLATLEYMRRVLDIDDGGNEVSSVGVNVSYHPALYPIARILNMFTGRAVPNKWALMHVPHWYVARRIILDTLNKLAPLGTRRGRAGMFDLDTHARITDRFWKSNRWLAERLDRDLRGLGYPVDPSGRHMPSHARSPLTRWMRR